MRICRRAGRLLLGTLMPIVDPERNDVINKESKTYKAYLERKVPDETGWERLKFMFRLDEFDRMSTELNAVYQSGLVGFLIGAIYGGIIQSRTTYMNFMENNQATAFKSHLEAKRKLQDQVTVSFAKGAYRWGWRLGLFTTSYYGIVTFISVYRGKSSIYEYLAAGGVTGAMFKFSMGPKGMAAGGIIGLGLGAVAGTASMLIMKLSGTTIEDVRYWQHKWRLDRDEQIASAVKSQAETHSLMLQHDASLEQEKEKASINLDNVE